MDISEVKIIKISLLKLDKNPYLIANKEYFDNRMIEKINAKFLTPLSRLGSRLGSCLGSRLGSCLGSRLGRGVGNDLQKIQLSLPSMPTIFI